MSLTILHSARQLLTLRGPAGPRRGRALDELHIIDDGAVLIDDGIIREVGPTRRLENLAGVRKAREMSAAGRVVMPGFVDSHTHIISGPSRLSGAAMSDRDAVLDNVAAVRETTARRLTAQATSVLRLAIAHGTTSIESKSGYGLNASGELKILRVLTALGDSPLELVPTFCGANVVPPEFDGRAEDYIRWMCDELLPLVHRRGLARFVDGRCDPGAFTAEQLRPYYRSAQGLGLDLKMHVSQFGETGGLALSSEFRFVSLDHLEHLGEGDLARLRDSGAVATLAPASTFFDQKHPYAPARDMIESGIPVALASGYNRVSSPTFNMQVVVFLACHHYGMTAAEAISAATINGACALKLAHRLGSIEAGKQADLLVLNIGDYRELSYEFGVNLVDMTIKRGVVVHDRSGVRWPTES